MAIQATSALDLAKQALIQALLHPVTSDPSSPVAGQVWYRTDLDRLSVQTSAAVKRIPWTDESSAMTGAEILAALVTVDGPGSGLDADTLDGQQATAFALASQLTGLASEAYVDAAVAALVDAAPGTLDTLNELAAALGDDPNFAATITASLATKTAKFAGDVGNGSSSTIDFVHSLGTLDVQVQGRVTATGRSVLLDWEVLDANTVRLYFGAVPSAGQYRVVVTG